MSEATARQKFSCPACGGEARWDPAKKELACPFCGTTSPAQVELNAAGEEVRMDITNPTGVPVLQLQRPV